MKHWIKLISVILLITVVSMVYNFATAKENEQRNDPELEMTWIEHEIEYYLQRQINAHNMAEAARGLGYTEEHSIIQSAKEVWVDAETNIISLRTKLEEIRAKEEARWAAKKEEYPVATEIWIYLTDLGYNEYVVAGIIGNMMAEAGGQTLDIQVDAYSPGYYGVCQWSLKYNPQLNNTNLTTQLNHLVSSMEYEFDTFGKNYDKYFNYHAFTTMQDEKEAALAFAKCYERCGSGSYNVRKKNAQKAYEYFIS